MANSGKTLSDVTPEIDKIMESLKICDDYTTSEVKQYMKTIDSYSYPWKHSQALAVHMTKAGFAEVFPPMWNAFCGSLQDLEVRGIETKTFELMMRNFTNLSDESPELGIALGKCGAINLMFQGLEQMISAHDTVVKAYLFNQVATSILQILHNSIRFSNHNRTIYRNCGAIEILKTCLKVHSKLWKLFALMVLAYVANDSESGLLASSEQSIHVLTNILKAAVTKDSHKNNIDGSIFSVFETLDAINHLAINDDNKVAISKDNIIPGIINILKQDGFTLEERRVAAEALWNLAFIESIRNSDELQGAIPTLKELVKTEDKDLKGACESALFQIEGAKADIGPPSTTERPPSPPPSYIEAISEPQTNPSRNRIQIMVSYQWDSQPRAIQIRDKLLEAGYQVWMDITNMRGNLLSGMADAVQKSDVILLCMTERYKDSKSCRSEAAYAYKLEKNIIPLLLEKGYEPDGWLGLLQGMELHYAFYSDAHVQSSLGELLRAIKDCIGSSEDTIDGPIIPTKQAVEEAVPARGSAPNPAPNKPAIPTEEASCQHTPKPRPVAVRDWTTDNVKDWLRDNDLGDLCASLNFCKGSHLKMLYTQYKDDADKFKTELKSDYNMNGPACLQFTVALKDLFDVQQVGSPANDEPTNSETTKSKACLIL